MRIHHLFTGDDGRSHFGSLELADHASGGPVSLPATEITFGVFPAGRTHGYTRSPRRHFVVNISGAAELGVGSGETRTIGAGDVVFAEDTSGEGHRSLTGSEPRRVLMVAIPDDFDVTPWRVGAGE
ncbi:MAG: hypothetical protein AB7Q42_13360 [Acidimicrobiia bacterium]